MYHINVPKNPIDTVKTKWITLCVLILLPIFVFGIVDGGTKILRTKAALAQGLPGVFGGNILTVLRCHTPPLCPSPLPGKPLLIGPPGGGVFNPLLFPVWIRITPFTLWHEYFQCHPGAWILGNYTPPTPCWWFNGWHCVWIPVIGDAFLIGTSF